MPRGVSKPQTNGAVHNLAREIALVAGREMGTEAIGRLLRIPGHLGETRDARLTRRPIPHSRPDGRTTDGALPGNVTDRDKSAQNTRNASQQRPVNWRRTRKLGQNSGTLDVLVIRLPWIPS